MTERDAGGSGKGEAHDIEAAAGVGAVDVQRVEDTGEVEPLVRIVGDNRTSVRGEPAVDRPVVASHGSQAREAAQHVDVQRLVDRLEDRFTAPRRLRLSRTGLGTGSRREVFGRDCEHLVRGPVDLDCLIRIRIEITRQGEEYLELEREVVAEAGHLGDHQRIGRVPALRFEVELVKPVRKRDVATEHLVDASVHPFDPGDDDLPLLCIVLACELGCRDPQPAPVEQPRQAVVVERPRT